MRPENFKRYMIAKTETKAVSEAKYKAYDHFYCLVPDKDKKIFMDLLNREKR